MLVNHLDATIKFEMLVSKVGLLLVLFVPEPKVVAVSETSSSLMFPSKSRVFTSMVYETPGKMSPEASLNRAIESIRQQETNRFSRIHQVSNGHLLN